MLQPKVPKELVGEQENYHVLVLNTKGLVELDGGSEEERPMGDKLRCQIDKKGPTRQDKMKTLNDLKTAKKLEDISNEDKMMKFNDIIKDYISNVYSSVSDLLKHPIMD